MSQALTRLLHRLAPRLPLPAEDEAPPSPSAAQKRRYYAAGIGTVLLSGGIGYGGYALSSFRIPGAELQLAPASGGDILSALFLGLGIAPGLGLLLSRLLLSPPAFAYYRHRYAARHGGADLIPLCRWLSAAMLALVLGLHLLLRDTYVAADRDKLWWSDFFALGSSEAPWSEVSELRLVRLFKPLIGGEREKWHLVWVLRDGRRVKTAEGNGLRLQPEEIRRAVEYSKERGVPVQKVERDE